MGFLLLQYEFQRANREVNLCNRKTVRINNQLTRATKRIEKMESVFSKEKTALETDWNNRKSTMTQGLSQMAITITNSCGGDPAAAANAFRLQMQNIVIAVGTVVVLLAAVFFSDWMNMSIGMLVHEGSILVVILNGMRLLRYSLKAKQQQVADKKLQTE